MKKTIFALLAALVLGFGFSQTAMVTGSFTGEGFSGGVELATPQTGPVEGLFGATLDTENAFAYAGVRVQVNEVEDGYVYTALRLGAFNPLSEVFTSPDAYGAYLGVGGLDRYSMVEGGVRVTTVDFSDYSVGFVVSVGIGSGR